MDTRVRELLDGVAADFLEVLGDRLVGIYVHGSIAFGCFRWEVSDVDFLAVVSEALPLSDRAALIRKILARVPQGPEKGIEMSVVTAEVCRNFVYPTPYELHFSNAHLENYLSDVEGYCERLRGADPDLSGHFSVTYDRGIVWYGRPVRDVFSPVPREDLLAGIFNDAADASGGGVWENPVYFVLNLCRVIACREQGLLLSKAGGGEWALENLPEEHAPAVRSALTAYTVGGEMRPDGVEAFRDYALDRLGIAQG